VQTRKITDEDHSAGALVYLGEAISQDLTCEKDITRRIGLASGIVRNLNKMWAAEYGALLLTNVLLYHADLGSVYQSV